MLNNRTYVLYFFLLLNIFVIPQARVDSNKYSYNNMLELKEQLDYIFNDPNFNNANWGVLIQSVETGEYFYKKNEDKLFMPASNLKLFTTAAGLCLLGPEYKYKTKIYTSGKIDGSILRGNLIVKGSGDPTISGRLYNGDMLKVFKDWADSLSELGIDEIDGNIIGDDNLFEDVGLGNGWEWDYESYWYSAPTSAISFNDNCIDIYVTTSKKDNLAQINISPNTKYAIILNNVTVVPKDSTSYIDVYRERGTNVITVSGTIKQNDSIKTYVTVNNPTQYSMVVLKNVLEEKGISVNGVAIDVDDLSSPLNYKNTSFLFEQESIPLKEIIKITNKNSQNFYAEQLLKTIGLEKEHYGSVENGIDACNDFYESIGLNPENFVIVDGSGLSRLNLVSPKNIVTLLTYMYKHQYSKDYVNSLPVAGVDGTLAKRLTNTSAQRKIRAKTGFLGNVRSLSGYAFTADNEILAFSIIANNFTVPVKLVENIQDLVCLRLANFHRNNRRISGE